MGEQYHKLEEERKKICDEIFQGAQNDKDKAQSQTLAKLGEIERKLRHIVEDNNLTQNYLKKKCADNVWRLMHNVVLGSRNTAGFEVGYLHDQPIKDGDFWEIRIDDMDEKDAKCKTGKWVPPIMVSWDVDSIDPRDCPCTMRQEAHGMSAEECMSFAEEIANTERLVFWETVEFNPDLWEGYRDERVQWSINEYETGSYQRRPRQPTNKNQHRMDREAP